VAGLTHVVLIRGINVGGKNKVPMAPLRQLLTDAGLGPVETYIQSGNVLVTAPTRSSADIEDTCAQILTDNFSVTTVVVCLAGDTLVEIVNSAPQGFGNEPGVYKYDVAFLRQRLTPAQAVAAMSVRDGIDTVTPGVHAVYLSRLAAKAGSSYLPKLTARPEYQDMTIRNWRTTTALAGMVLG
jgi:uncharacterized protein (DUF1697 family)